MKEAKDRNFKHIIHLDQLMLGLDHVALIMKTYSMDLRHYLTH
jgi:hypothetical protein